MEPLFPLMVLSELTLEQLYDARLYVEIGMAALATKNWKPGQMQALKDLLPRMAGAVEADDPLLFTDLDWKFHLLIGEASGNEVLLSAYYMIKDMLRQYLEKTNYQSAVIATSLNYHQKILEAMEAGEQAAAERLMREHILIAKESLLSAMKKGEAG